MKTLLTVGWAFFFAGVTAWFVYERWLESKPVLRVQCDAVAGNEVVLLTGAEWSGNAVMIKFAGHRPAHWTTCAVEMGKPGQ